MYIQLVLLCFHAKAAHDLGRRYVFLSFMTRGRSGFLLVLFLTCDRWFPMVLYMSIFENHSRLITAMASPKTMDHGIKNESVNISNDKARH